MNGQVPAESKPTEMILASQGQRFLNYLLDGIFYVMFSFCIGMFSAFIGLGDLIQNANNFVLGMIIMTIYYVPQEALMGRTLGKLITGTKAVNEDGSEMSFAKTLGRTACRFIPFDAFSFFGGNGRPRGWHDKVSKTVVITLR